MASLTEGVKEEKVHSKTPFMDAALESFQTSGLAPEELPEMTVEQLEKVYFEAFFDQMLLAKKMTYI